jgi:hypothetical protein
VKKKGSHIFESPRIRAGPQASSLTACVASDATFDGQFFEFEWAYGARFGTRFSALQR